MRVVEVFWRRRERTKVCSESFASIWPAASLRTPVSAGIAVRLRAADVADGSIATEAEPIVLPAPVRFSIRNDWPICFDT